MFLGVPAPLLIQHIWTSDEHCWFLIIQHHLAPSLHKTVTQIIVATSSTSPHVKPTPCRILHNVFEQLTPNLSELIGFCARTVHSAQRRSCPCRSPASVHWNFELLYHRVDQKVPLQVAVPLAQMLVLHGFPSAQPLISVQVTACFLHLLSTFTMWVQIDSACAEEEAQDQRLLGSRRSASEANRQHLFQESQTLGTLCAGDSPWVLLPSRHAALRISTPCRVHIKVAEALCSPSSLPEDHDGRAEEHVEAVTVCETLGGHTVN